MSIHQLSSRTSFRALSLFLKECSLDRSRGNLPLRDLVDAESVSEFQKGLDRLVRSLLRDYSLEKRSFLLKQAMERRSRRQELH